MSTQEPSRCCVCGEPTTKRCQACAKSGIDLFFCSPEHQKLVWKNHKQVCGPSAHPFRYPPLSPEEVDELLAIENAPVTDRDRAGVIKLLSYSQGGLSPEKETATWHAFLSPRLAECSSGGWA